MPYPFAGLPLIPLPRPSPRKRGEGEDGTGFPPHRTAGIGEYGPPLPSPHLPSLRLREDRRGRGAARQSGIMLSLRAPATRSP
nr:hypothetical protein SHINE37_40234 [Rhizobiaceae bacterium]